MQILGLVQMGICAKCVLNRLFFQYTFGNISSMAFLLLSKLNSNTLGYLTAFHPDICSVSTCVWIQTHPNICEFKKSTLNRSKFTGLIMLSRCVLELGLYVLQILEKPLFLFFHCTFHIVVFIFKAGRASMNCQRPRNELRKIFRMLYFRRQIFINGKKQRIQVCCVWLSSKRPRFV